MINVSQDDAKRRLAELIDAALHGEQIIITRDAQHVVQLVPLPSQGRNRHAGTAKGLIVLAEDFDAPLSDFAEYTR